MIHVTMTTKQPSRQSRKRERQTRYLSQAIQLEEAVNPHIIRSTMTMVSLAILSFLVWAGFTNINELARTPGEIVPHGMQQTVQHLEGGIVKAITVQEGDKVAKGDVLFALHEAGIQEDLNRAKGRQIALEMQEERLRAFIDARQPDFSKYSTDHAALVADQEAIYKSMLLARQTESAIIAEQITQKKQSIKTLQNDLNTARQSYTITKDIYDRRAELNRMGYASDMQLLETKQHLNTVNGEIKSLQNRIAVAQTEIKEFEGRLGSLSASQRDEVHEKLAQILSEKAQNTEIIQKLEERSNRLQIRATASGMVKGLSVHTVGAVIQPGQVLLDIIPLDKPMEVQVKISPQDIGHLQIGQPVQVKFSTYDFSRYGSVQGQLEYISATTFTGPNGERYYQGRIRLYQNYVGHDRANMILPGMTVMADVITGEKTILQYLLKPIHMSLKTAFTER